MNAHVFTSVSEICKISFSYCGFELEMTVQWFEVFAPLPLEFLYFALKSADRCY